MNFQQRIFLWLGIFVFAFLTLHPPWIEVYARPFGDSGITHFETPVGTRWLWNAKSSGPYRYIQVDFQRLIPEWLVVAAVTGGLLWTFKGGGRHSVVENHH